MNRNWKSGWAPLVLAAAGLAGCGGTGAENGIECTVRMPARSTRGEVQQAIALVKAGSLDPCGDGIVRTMVDVDEIRGGDGGLQLRFRMQLGLWPDRQPQDP